MTGSGMGCPDWPKCFGQWVPPTDISELPADYKSRFQVAGREIADFDPFKTWVEYLNRLVGVVIGLLGIITAVLSVPFFRVRRRVTWLSFLGLFLIILEGGIGAYVVKTDLQVGLVSLHMAVAMGVVAVYMMAITEAFQGYFTDKSAQGISPGKNLKAMAALLLGLTLIQMLVGTQIREQIDLIAQQNPDRSTWIAALDSVYVLHKFSYYAIVGIWLYLAWKLRPFFGQMPLWKNLISLIGVVLVAEVAFGLGMHHFEVPVLLQPLHLWFASLLFAAEFGLLASMWKLSPVESTEDDKETSVHDYQEGRTYIQNPQV